MILEMPEAMMRAWSNWMMGGNLVKGLGMRHFGFGSWLVLL